MILIGIDLGLGGAVAVFDDGEPFGLHDMPVLDVGAGKKTKREYNLAELSNLLKKHTDGEKRVLAILEKVHAMPGQGVSSMFKFGFGAGAVEGVLAALQIPYEKVAPVRWKKVMMGDMGKDKDAARQRAIQLFPDMSQQMSRKKDHGRAEALLLAEYLRRKLGKAETQDDE